VARREKDAFEKAHGVKLTLLPFFIRAVVESLAVFPLMNASFTDEGSASTATSTSAGDRGRRQPHRPGHSQRGTALGRGLALAAGALIEKARSGKLGADDLAGGTFTVNNTGANGSILSAPILVPGKPASSRPKRS
jgi:2-oxoisovalerate dehydrogenase E2 component (dihydrolipoyl transacylase)